MKIVARLPLLITLSGVALAACSAEPRQANQPGRAAEDMHGITVEAPRADVEKQIVDKHPVIYLVYAQQLWSAGRKDEAVFWFYVGQLRYRFHLAANPGLDPSGDAALFASLHETIGSQINLYAGADPDKWARQIDEVLRWDSEHANGFTSKTEHAKELAEIRDGLTKLHDTVVKNKEQLRSQREQNGIGANGVVNGVYVEEQNERMPKDWPALVAPMSLEKLSGVYADDGNARLGPIFFFDDTTRNARRLTDVELSLAGPEALRVVGRRNGAEVLSKTIFVRLTSDAAVFEYSRSAEQAGLVDGGEKHTITLHENAIGELVIERASVTEGHRQNSAMPVRLTYTFWNRAHRVR